jgi:formate dehydrogenase assembly factor FdhD
MSAFISAPTNVAVRLASDFGMILIAFAREQGINVHTQG